MVPRGRRPLRVAMVTSPASPYTVGVLDDPVLGRLDSDATALVAELPRGHAGTVLVQIADGTLWVIDAAFRAEFPLVITLDGEEISIASIANGASDTFGRTVANGWGNASIGGAWTPSGTGAAIEAATSASASAARCR